MGTVRFLEGYLAFPITSPSLLLDQSELLLCIGLELLCFFASFNGRQLRLRHSTGCFPLVFVDINLACKDLLLSLDLLLPFFMVLVVVLDIAPVNFLESIRIVRWTVEILIKACAEESVLEVKSCYFVMLLF